MGNGDVIIQNGDEIILSEIYLACRTQFKNSQKYTVV